MKQVTIEEARKILGEEAVRMSDEQLQGLIDDLSLMAKWALEEAARLRAHGHCITGDRGKND